MLVHVELYSVTLAILGVGENLSPSEKMTISVNPPRTRSRDDINLRIYVGRSPMTRQLVSSGRKTVRTAQELGAQRTRAQ